VKKLSMGADQRIPRADAVAGQRLPVVASLVVAGLEAAILQAAYLMQEPLVEIVAGSNVDSCAAVAVLPTKMFANSRGPHCILNKRNCKDIPLDLCTSVAGNRLLLPSRAGAPCILPPIDGGTLERAANSEPLVLGPAR